jgi:hypothetical protein
VLDPDAQNGVQRQKKNDDEHDGQNEQPQQPFENELHFYFRFAIYDLRASVELRIKS